MKITQYAYGRGDQGFDSAASSGAEFLLQGRVGESVRNTARYSRWSDGRMVMELQAFPSETDENLPSTLVLSGSCWVTTNRPNEYTHSLIIPPEGEADPGRISTALELLLWKEYFLSPTELLDVISKKESLNDEEIPDGDIHRLWQGASGVAAQESLEGLNLYAFLARYWETCWFRYSGQEFSPLFVVATSPDRFREVSDLDTVLVDGVAFFHERVLPFLPEAVKEMTSVSFSSMDSAPEAQKGSACLVCVPSGTAINREPVYRVFNNSALDGRVDNVFLRLGEAMHRGSMPESYRRLRSRLGDCLTAEKDFDLIYGIVEMEGMLEDLTDPELEEEDWQKLALRCAAGLTTALPGILRRDGLLPEEVPVVLYPMELRLAGCLERFGRQLQPDLFQTCVRLWKSLPERCARLTEEERQTLSEAWARVLSRTWEPLDWDSRIPVLLIAGEEEITQETDALLRRTLGNGQTFRTPIGPDHGETLDQLMTLVQRCRTEDRHMLADALRDSLAAACEPDDQLLSPTRYLSLLRGLLRRRGETQLSPEAGGAVIRDIDALAGIRRKILGDNGVTDGAALYDLYALDELAPLLHAPQSGRPAAWDGLEGLELAMAGQLMACDSSYQPAYYDNYLEKWRSLPERYAALEEGTRGKLAEAWEGVLLRVWEPLEWDLTIPLLKLSREKELAGRSGALMGRLLANGQPFTEKLSPEHSDILDQLFHLVQRCRVEGQQELGSALMTYLGQQCVRDSRLLSPTRYLDQLDKGPIPPAAREAMLQDLERLVREHAAIVGEQGMADSAEALEEIRYQDSLFEHAQRPPLRLQEDERTVLTAAMERLLTDWCTQRDRVFDPKLYQALLGRAVTLPLRGKKLPPEELTRMQEAYDQSLTCYYSGCGEGSCPLSVLMAEDPGKTKPWEAQIARQVLDTQLVPADAGALVNRMVRLRSSVDTTQTADLYREILLTKSFSVPDEVFPAYLAESARQLQNDRSTVVHRKVEEDILKLLEASRDVQGRTVIRSMENYADWYKDMHRPGDEELEKATEALFQEKLAECAEDVDAQVGVVQLFCKTTTDTRGGRESIEQLLFGRLEGMTLAEMARDPDALQPVQVYCALRPARAEMARQALEGGIRASAGKGLAMEDVTSVIRCGEAMGLEDVGDQLMKVLQGVADKIMPEEVCGDLAAYCRTHPQLQEPVIACLETRVSDGTREDRIETVIDLMRLLTEGEVKTERKSRSLTKVLREISEHTEHMELGDTLVSSLLQVAADTKEHQADQKKKLTMRLFEAYPASGSFPRMEEAARLLDITPGDCGREDVWWQTCFFHRSAETVAARIREQTPDVQTMRAMAGGKDAEGKGTEPDADVKQMNELHDRLRASNNPQSNEVIYTQRETLQRVCREAVEKDNSLYEPEVLSRVISAFSGIDPKEQDWLFTRSLTDAVFGYIPQLLADDSRFSRLVTTGQSIREVKRCFDQLGTRENAAGLEEKRRVVRAACDVMDMEDSLARGRLSPGDAVGRLAGKTEMNLSGWSAVRDALLDYGNETLQDADPQTRLVPSLLANLETAGEEPRVQWQGFLDKALPLGEGDGWAQADIWRSGDNAFGKLALCMSLLSRGGAEKLHRSFVSYLNASAIGRNARRGARYKALRKHSQSLSGGENAMMDWLLKDDGSRASEKKTS